MDGLADAGHAGRVGHREVCARLQGRLRDDLDLAAEVHEEDAVGDVYDFDAVNASGGLDDCPAVLGGARVDRQVAYDRVAPDADDVNRADVAARAPDGRRQPAEGARARRELDAQRQAVARAGRVLHQRQA